MIVQVQGRVALLADPGNTLMCFHRHSFLIMHLCCKGPAQSKDLFKQKQGHNFYPEAFTDSKTFFKKKVSWDSYENRNLYSNLLELCSASALGSCLGLDSDVATQAQLFHESKNTSHRISWSQNGPS